MLPSQKYLKSRISYDPRSGEVTWLTGHGGRKIGSRVGTLTNGTIRVRLDKKDCALTCLIWIYMTGSKPAKGYEIDHIDRNPSNNRWNNLRLLTRSQNQANTNTYKNNSTGIRGVHLTKWGYRAVISLAGKNRHIGFFQTAEEASKAYQARRLEFHGAL